MSKFSSVVEKIKAVLTFILQVLGLLSKKQ
nr:MAG TPA: hypothetical protein [Microviridae sp.]